MATSAANSTTTAAPSPTATAVAELAGIESLWQAWLTGDRSQLASFSSYADLHHAALHSTKELTHGQSASQLSRTGLLLATTKGDIDTEVQWLRTADNSMTAQLPTFPTLNSTAEALAAHAGTRGPVWAISTACSSGLTALIDAACILLDGDADHMLVMGLDYTGPGNQPNDRNGFVQDGFHALKAISPTACRPFDRDRDGLTLGSAAAGCLMSREKSAQTRALLTGWGVASDAIHMTAPDRHAGGLILAMQNALKSANLTPEQIDLLLLHGTGTRYNDSMEAVAIDTVFPPNRQKGPALTAVKGLIGHSLGASGIIETTLAVRILETGILPPITGLTNPERGDLDFVITPRKPQRLNHIMKVASGFGGLNAAIILSHPNQERFR